MKDLDTIPLIVIKNLLGVDNNKIYKVNEIREN